MKSIYIINRLGMALAVLILGSTRLVAQTLEIDSLVGIVATENLELKALSHEHAARSYEMQGENTLKGPSVEYSPFYSKGYHGMASSELIVSQEFDFPTLYGQRKKQTRMEEATMQRQYETRRREIMLEARLLVLDIICQNQLIELLNERCVQSKNTTTLIEKRLTAGDANALENNKARLIQMQSLQELAQAQNELQALQLQLQALAGSKPVCVSIKTLPEIKEGTMKTDAETDGSNDPYNLRLPEVEEAEQALATSQHNEKNSRMAWLPSLSVGYRRNTEEAARLNGFLVGASFPLYSKSSRQKAARQRTISDEINLQQIQQQVRMAQQQRYDELNRLHSVLDHSDTQLLRETLDLLAKAMQHGQITALQYYTECTDIYNQLISHINLHCQYVKTYAELYLR